MSPKRLFEDPLEASDHEDDHHGEERNEHENGGDSEHNTDSESYNTCGSPSASDFTIKPIVSKPMEDSSKRKRTAAENEHEHSVKDSKKRRKISGDGDNGDAKKGSGLNRLWNQDDEIAILNGMIEYRSKKGLDPNADSSAFYEFVKNTIQADVSKNQLMEKIRRLKKKYKINAQKTVDGDHVFAKPHEKITFELAKKIWETNGYNNKKLDNDNGTKCNGALKQSNGGDKDEAEEEEEEEVVEKNDEDEEMEKNQAEEFWSNHPSLNESLRLMKCMPGGSVWIMNATETIMPLIEKSRLKELEDRWRKLHLEEIALYLHKIELIQEQGKAILDSLKSMD